jgi:hypothetical protein
MRKIIRLTERDLTRMVKRIINEKYDELNLFLIRRSDFINELIEKNIKEVEEDGTLFSDEFEFADNIINWVVQDMKLPEHIDENEVIDYIKDTQGEYILSQYTEVDDEWDDED